MSTTHAMGRRWSTSFAAAALLFLGTSCSGNDLPTEADLPPEAELKYPGSVETRRSFNEGETGTYIDGGSAYRAPRLSITYSLDGATRTELFDWYEAELVERSWLLDRRSPDSMGADKSVGDLDYQLGVSTALADASGYTVIITLAYDDR